MSLPVSINSFNNDRSPVFDLGVPVTDTYFSLRSGQLGTQRLPPTGNGPPVSFAHIQSAIGPDDHGRGHRLDGGRSDPTPRLRAALRHPVAPRLRARLRLPSRGAAPSQRATPRRTRASEAGTPPPLTPRPRRRPSTGRWRRRRQSPGRRRRWRSSTDWSRAHRRELGVRVVAGLEGRDIGERFGGADQVEPRSSQPARASSSRPARVRRIGTEVADEIEGLVIDQGDVGDAAHFGTGGRRGQPFDDALDHAVTDAKVSLRSSRSQAPAGPSGQLSPPTPASTTKRLPSEAISMPRGMFRPSANTSIVGSWAATGATIAAASVMLPAAARTVRRLMCALYSSELGPRPPEDPTPSLHAVR